MTVFSKLENIRNKSGTCKAKGLSDDVIKKFLAIDPKLAIAIESAEHAYEHLSTDERDLLKKSEDQVYLDLQSDFVNFYARDVVQPFIAIAAYGPWMISAYGAVIYDCGGYGMLGSGHNPESVFRTLSHRYVMANIMTPSFSQRRFTHKMREMIGFTRSSDQRQPFSKFVCLNSGSEAMSLALRFSDANAKIMTTAGGRHAGKSIKFMAITGSFHGRTDRPAQISHSCLKSYHEHLASFQNRDNVIFVEQNNNKDLEAKWQQALKDNVFIEAFVLEPVMGEGMPGSSLKPEFYKLARELTTKNGSLLIIDSIQAGLRGFGCLSIVDYPDFQEIPGPDIESYSKAVNAGQFPLSVLGISDQVAASYKTGLYGNTMTANPRALEVAITVLDNVTSELRHNIVSKGHEFVDKLHALNKKLGGVFTHIDGTGLLVGAHLDPAKYKVVGPAGLEMHMRLNGVNVIHGGKNALRFTPHFSITSSEIDLIIDHVEMAVKAAAIV